MPGPPVRLSTVASLQLLLAGADEDRRLSAVRSRPVDAVVTDLVFADGATGIDLIAALRRERPDLEVVAMTGTQDQALRSALRDQGVRTLLDKPLEAREVVAAVQRATVERGRDLLLVDDDRLIRLVLGRMFEDGGFVVRTATTIDEARTAIGAKVPDVVVSDLNVRDGSGLTLLQFVHDHHPSVRFIMLSGSPDAESVIAAYRLRVFDFVIKSADTMELLRAVDGAVSKSSRR
jgi:DNA-binding NtrC family response regulator